VEAKVGNRTTSSEFKLDRRIDPISTLALTLAALSAAWQVYGFLQGPKVQLMEPTQIEIRNDQGWTIIHAQMSYVNQGRAEYPGVISDERVEFTLAGRPEPVRLSWQAFIKTDYVNNQIKVDEDARPFVVPGTSAVSHQSSFYARQIPCKSPDCRYRNFVQWKHFVDAIATAGAMEFRFQADALDGQKLRTSCRAQFDRDLVAFMREHLQIATSCEPKNAAN
jgi:hypothetical protein